jgi:hypothetical protein
MERLPSFVRELFWEGLAEDPDPNATPTTSRSVCSRPEASPAVRWLLERYGHERLSAGVASGRLRGDHVRFWDTVLADA